MWLPSQILSIYAKTGSTNPVRLLVRFGSWLNAQNKETGLSYHGEVCCCQVSRDGLGILKIGKRDFVKELLARCNAKILSGHVSVK